MRAITLLLGASAALLLAATAARAEVHSSEQGTVYVSEGLAQDAVVPVVIVQGGLADSTGHLWPALSARMKLVMAETVNFRELLRRPEGGGEVGKGIDDVLREAARHHAIDGCPWIVVGFSTAASHMANVVLADPERFQGLVIANGATRGFQLLADLRAARGFPVTVLNGSTDVVSRMDQAAALFGTLRKAGLDATLGTVEGDHAAPMGEGGAAKIAALIERASKRRIPERPVVRPWRTIETTGDDDLILTADLYDCGDKKAPIVLLFHQARSSRGEYRPIASRLVKVGYNCLALDARSGAQWAGTLNETAARARAKELAQDYVAAKVDLEWAIRLARKLEFEGKLALWGSSYSAALVMFLGAKEDVDCVLAFSPGDYLQPRGSTPEAAAKLAKPVLVVCPPDEEEGARALFDVIASEKKEILVHAEGLHGSRTLYLSPKPEPAWEKVLAFLESTLRH